MATAQDVVRVARSWIGTPFQHQARVKGKAGDCVALVIKVAHELGISTFDITGYGRQPVPAMFRKLLDANLDRVEIEAMQPGDILWVRFTRDPQHVAILSENGTIIHSNERIGRCVEHRLDDKWRSRIVRVYRYRGLRTDDRRQV